MRWILVFLALLLFANPAFGLRCGGRIINVGDSRRSATIRAIKGHSVGQTDISPRCKLSNFLFNGTVKIIKY